jgi:hypothetical protein
MNNIENIEMKEVKTNSWNITWSNTGDHYTLIINGPSPHTVVILKNGRKMTDSIITGIEISVKVGEVNKITVEHVPYPQRESWFSKFSNAMVNF